MGKRGNSHTTSSFSSDRRQWERIFRTLIEMLQSQQADMETLADERKFLEQYIHQQHDHCTSIVRDLESHIAQLEKEEAKGVKIQEAKFELMLDVKQRAVLCYKKQYEYAEDDIVDFCTFLEALRAEILELKEKLKPGEADGGRAGAGDSKHVESSKEAEQYMLDLKGQIRKLKHSYKSICLKKDAEVSALLAEKDFVWHQSKKMENDYNAGLKLKNIELEHANEVTCKLQQSLQDLQTSVNGKNEIIAELKARHESDKRKHNEEANEKIKQLQLDKDELCSLAKEKDETITKLKSDLAKLEMDVCSRTKGKSIVSKVRSADASLNPSGSNPRKCYRKHKSKNAKKITKKHRGVNDGSSGSRASAPVQGLVRCSNKRRTRSESSVDRPALFHSNFKVPKLKNSPTG